MWRVELQTQTRVHVQSEPPQVAARICLSLGGQLFHHLTPTPRFAAWSYLQHSEQPGFQSRPVASTTRGREHLDGHLEVATEPRAFFFLAGMIAVWNIWNMVRNSTANDNRNNKKAKHSVSRCILSKTFGARSLCEISKMSTSPHRPDPPVPSKGCPRGIAGSKQDLPVFWCIFPVRVLAGYRVSQCQVVALKQRKGVLQKTVGYGWTAAVHSQTCQKFEVTSFKLSSWGVLFSWMRCTKLPCSYFSWMPKKCLPYTLRKSITCHLTSEGEIFGKVHGPRIKSGILRINSALSVLSCYHFKKIGTKQLHLAWFLQIMKHHGNHLLSATPCNREKVERWPNFSPRPILCRFFLAHALQIGV